MVAPSPSSRRPAIVDPDSLRQSVLWHMPMPADTSSQNLRHAPYCAIPLMRATLALRMYADESLGERLQNIWLDIPPIGAQAAERLGHPTQKPLALLERIIETSSNP